MPHPSQVRDITAQELYAPVSFREIGRLMGVGAGNVAQGIGQTARTAYETPTALGSVLAGIANAGSSFGAGVRSGFTGENYVGNEYRGLSLKDMFGGTNTPSQQIASQPAAPQAPATAPQAPATAAPVTQALPQFRIDTQSGTQAYQVDPSAAGWKPALARDPDTGRNTGSSREGGLPFGYTGPLSHVNVSRDKNGTLTFSGSGRKINQDGTEYQAPPTEMNRVQQAMSEVASLFEGGQPRNAQDQKLASSLLGALLQSEDAREMYGRKAEDDMRNLMIGSKLRMQEQAANRKPISVDDQIAAKAYEYITQLYRDNPKALTQSLIALRAKQPYGMSLTGSE